MVQRLIQFPDAQVESLPPFIPTWARGPLKPMARMAASFLANKHEAASDPEAALLATVVPGFERLRAALQGGRFLTGTFSYADVTMALTLQFIQPVDERFIPLGPHRGRPGATRPSRSGSRTCSAGGTSSTPSIALLQWTADPSGYCIPRTEAPRRRHEHVVPRSSNLGRGGQAR